MRRLIPWRFAPSAWQDHIPLSRVDYVIQVINVAGLNCFQAIHSLRRKVSLDKCGLLLCSCFWSCLCLVLFYSDSGCGLLKLKGRLILPCCPFDVVHCLLSLATGCDCQSWVILQLSDPAFLRYAMVFCSIALFSMPAIPQSIAAPISATSSSLA